MANDRGCDGVRSLIAPSFHPLPANKLQSQPHRFRTRPMYSRRFSLIA
ncbi:MAG: hypothetical protein JWR40_1076, partial [Massilia sp.]|nr:hypothetical protein [Massilia sp.]